MTGRPPPRDGSGDHQEFNVDPLISYFDTIDDVNINDSFWNIVDCGQNNDFVFEDEPCDDDYHSARLTNQGNEVGDGHTVVSHTTPVLSRRKPCKVKKGQGPEGKLQMPHIDRNYNFQFGPSACYLKDHNITLKSNELAKIIRNIPQNLKREGITASHRERVHVKVKSAMHAWLDRNWYILYQRFEEEISVHARPNS
jgi:hypothetical protein